MNVIYEKDSRRILDKTDARTQRAVRRAIQLTEGKTGFRTATEIWRGCELVVRCDPDTATATIRIRPPCMAAIRRRSNWRNAYAEYADGVFRGNNTNTEVELI